MMMMYFLCGMAKLCAKSNACSEEFQIHCTGLKFCSEESESHVHKFSKSPASTILGLENEQGSNLSATGKVSAEP